MMRSADQRIKQALERLIRQLEAESPQHPGKIMPHEPLNIEDGGGYGDPTRDERPDFIKEDETGWQR